MNSPTSVKSLTVVVNVSFLTLGGGLWEIEGMFVASLIDWTLFDLDDGLWGRFEYS